MKLDNKLGIEDPAELAREEERITKLTTLEILDGHLFEMPDISTFSALARIHMCLFGDVYDFAGKLRPFNVIDDDFMYAPMMFLQKGLFDLDMLPVDTFDQIVAKYVELNLAHPFYTGNARALRLWLNAVLKMETGTIVDWTLVDPEKYHDAMVASPEHDAELKALLKSALTDNVDDRAFFMKNLDANYALSGYATYTTAELAG